eukprot:TRINITY_DN2086_c0_g1_i1.p2 TRINITY_DN2086_c0_g1~~TRINITY_DN2086_c0_g1_i1.p2  ORF type:complete len:114 (+),score=15.75 TRINITY_DN2086_c0_g1_i1:851-1192(+)
MLIYCVVAIGLVGFLGSFHCYLAFTNQTTNEKIKGFWKKRPNPYHIGFTKNYFSLFCAPVITKYNLDYRGAYEKKVYFSKYADVAKKLEKRAKRGNASTASLSASSSSVSLSN